MTVPQNCIIMTDQDDCPSGFTYYASFEGCFLRVSTAVNKTPTGANTHTHTNADHTHTVSGTVPSATFIVSGSGVATPAAGHTHAISNVESGNPSGLTISTEDHTPPYATLKLCRKD